VPKYNKPPLPVAGQLEKLKSRGLQIEDDAEALHYLLHIGYYRLSAYMLTFQERSQPDKPFEVGTTFRQILGVYRFDRELRLHAMDIIERIEVSVRSCFVNELSCKYGSHWYLNPKYFEPTYDHRHLIKKIESELHIDSVTKRRSKQHQEIFINHYFSKYGDPHLPPIWMVCECLSFGTWSLMYSSLRSKTDRKLVADHFRLEEYLLCKWLRSINQVRNICAHHSRLWNRKFVMKFEVLKEQKDLVFNDDHFYPFAVICYTILKRIAPTTDWHRKLYDLLSRYPEVKPLRMGFPLKWHEQPFWGLRERQAI
jgi:abortive infection bacteriophage resistance protein